ncbi:MAG TPA: beta-ketoacyl synthase N-terminal-like domain-containing protein [Burkholderiales bacterium]|nr:beta-ketoacyl synthase N-terminal-like domain-containing protein [Burkholderiales bacterium]
MGPSPRIAITGSGAVCGAGLTVEKIWAAVIGGQTAVTPITQWDAERWPVRVAAGVNGVKNQELVEDRKLHKSISRTDLFGIYAGGEAIKSSGIPAHRETLDAAVVPLFNDRSGLVVGSGGGTYNSNYEYFPLMTESGGDLRKFGAELGSTVNPMWLLKNLPNNVLCHVGIRHMFKGTNACITNQCAGGVLAVAEAAESLRMDEADRIAAVGHDTPIEPETVFGYHKLGLLSPDVLRPFDRARSGTIFGEGAAAVMLEKLDDAVARKTTILGEFLGHGCVTESTGVVDLRPDGDGPARAIALALADAGISAADVGMIVAHGNGTPASDASEAKGILRAFGGNPPPVTGFKWCVGHLLAASGILDLVLALESLRQGVVPGVPTLNTLDPEFSSLPVSRDSQKPRGDVVLVICRGFGGMNVALVVRAAKP